jgi:signal transduction histidine kinase
MSQAHEESPKRPRRVRREMERVARLNQLAEMGKLAAGLAHELKNPLSTLKLNLQLLEENVEICRLGVDFDSAGVSEEVVEDVFQS